MKKNSLMWIVLLACSTACAQSARTSYKIGGTLVQEDSESVVLHTNPPVHMQILPGGRTWPPLFIDENGSIYTGEGVFDSASGRLHHTAKKRSGEIVVEYPEALSVTVRKNGYLFRQGNYTCLVQPKSLGLGGSKTALDFFKDANFTIVPSDSQILALVGPPSDAETKYHISKIDLASCKVATLANIGDPDYLVEMGWSKQGGWWLTGSVEQTLLRSNDGKTWTSARLPPGLSALVSAYAVNANEVWLAAGLQSGTPANPYMLVYTVDGGKSWSSPRLNDPLLLKLPLAWRAGYQRVASPWIDDED